MNQALYYFSVVIPLIFLLRLTADFPPTAAAFCIRLFRTSAGAQTVVATVPAAIDAVI